MRFLATALQKISTQRKVIVHYFFTYVCTLAMCWICIGQMFEYCLTPNKLIKVEGVIDTTVEVGKKMYKSNRLSYELRIFFQDTTGYFRLTDIFQYRLFYKQINRGDTAEVYIRPKWLVPLGMGYRNDIYQMDLNGKTIFDISQRLKNAKGIIIFTLIAIPSFIFLGWYVKQQK